MTPRERIKPPHPKNLKEFCAVFEQEVPTNATRIGPRWFDDPNHLIRFSREHNWEPFAAGIYLGEERGGYRPTSALVTMLGTKSEKRVALDTKSAWLFLCGRDVLMEGVLGSPSFRAGEMVFVTDGQDNVLGYGMIFNPFDPRKHHAVFVKHLLDRGEYLRRER